MTGRPAMDCESGGEERTGSRERGPTAPRLKSRIWWWIVVACLIQCTAWVVWLKIAASAHVQDVPLATAEGR